ncbi:hypothetical protein CC78DRAFT_583510 [Lojkania enalia]|uniref:Protein kinase domain-containing protein n=1 Tax=Lojkania enalia TaxID=147567 RepID=A0A9P4N1I1_9PLEO|nr:hypothetical protein CC78DRAFT_583510 [Didymosphaeria enalia]
MKWPEHRLQLHQYTMLKWEVETFVRISHPNIVEFISAQGFRETHLEIFTVLREGNIEDLTKKDLFIRDPNLATSLLHQMLQALDYLAFKGIVHRARSSVPDDSHGSPNEIVELVPWTYSRISEFVGASQPSVVWGAADAAEPLENDSPSLPPCPLYSYNIRFNHKHFDTLVSAVCKNGNRLLVQ